MRAAKAAGYTHVRVSIDVHGNMQIEGSDRRNSDPPARSNPLDRLLAPS